MGDDNIALKSGDDADGVLCSASDRDTFAITGVDGQGSLTLTVEDLGEGPADSEIEVLIGYPGNGDVRPLEGFTVAHGETASQTIGSAVSEKFIVVLSTAKGRVPYRVRAEFAPEKHESERRSDVLEDGDDIVGRIAQGDDTDQFSVVGADGMGSLIVTVDRLADGPEDAELSVLIGYPGNGDVRPLEEFTVPHGGTASQSIGSKVADKFLIVLKATAGPVPYRVQVEFAKQRHESERTNDLLTSEESVVGRIRTGVDTDAFRIEGEAGQTLVVTVEDLGEGPPDSELAVVVGYPGNGDVRPIDEFTVGRGAEQSLSVVTARATSIITLAAEAGPVPYRLSARLE